MLCHFFHKLQYLIRLYSVFAMLKFCHKNLIERIFYHNDKTNKGLSLNAPFFNTNIFFYCVTISLDSMSLILSENITTKTKIEFELSKYKILLYLTNLLPWRNKILHCKKFFYYRTRKYTFIYHLLNYFRLCLNLRIQ